LRSEGSDQIEKKKHNNRYIKIKWARSEGVWVDRRPTNIGTGKPI